MSAGLLREAAALMRSRAEGTEPSPWTLDEVGVFAGSTLMLFADNDEQRRDAEHIASWHPAVALAVADWLDAQAERAEVGFHGKTWEYATAVARAYLGRDA